MSKVYKPIKIKQPKPPKFLEVSRKFGSPKLIAVRAITLVCENTLDGGTDIWLQSAKFEDDRTYDQICELLCVPRKLAADATTERKEAD
jgi:hypothetical protein